MGKAKMGKAKMASSLGNNGGIGGSGVFGHFGSFVTCSSTENSYYCNFTKIFNTIIMGIVLLFILYSN